MALLLIIGWIILSIALIIALFFISFIFPMKINNYFVNTYGCKAFSWILSIVQFIMILACLIEENKIIQLILFLILLLIIILNIIYRMNLFKNFGVDKLDIRRAIYANIAVMFGFIIFFMMAGIGGSSEKGGNKNV